MIMIATGVCVYFGSLPGPEPGFAITGDYEDKDKVSDGQIVIFNGMLA